VLIPQSEVLVCMSDERFALSPSATPPPTGADYDAIFAAVMETVRGRWFLTEYASRNRNADTELILAAIARATTSLAERRPAASLGEQLRIDLVNMATAIAETRREIAAIKPDGDARGSLSEASEELDSIVQTTERATSDILAAAEQVQEIAWTLRERGADGEACDALDRRATDIYTACSFQDLTGQRTRKVVEVMHFLEGRIRAMIEIWGDGGPEPKAADAAPVPHIRDDPEVGHLDQPDIDRMMPEPSLTPPPAGESASHADAAATDHNEGRNGGQNDGHDAVVWATGATSDHTEQDHEVQDHEVQDHPLPAAEAAAARVAVLEQAPIEVARAPRSHAALTLVLPDIPVPSERPPRVEPPRKEPAPAATIFGDAPASFGHGPVRADQMAPPSFGPAAGADVARVTAAADIDVQAASPPPAHLADDPDDILMPLPSRVSVADAVDEMLMSASVRRDVPPASAMRSPPSFQPIEIVDETRYESRSANMPSPAPARPLTIVAAAPIVLDPPIVRDEVPVAVAPPEPAPALERAAVMDPPAASEAADIAVAPPHRSAPTPVDPAEPWSAVVEEVAAEPEPIAAEAEPAPAEPPSHAETPVAAATQPDAPPPAADASSDGAMPTAAAADDETLAVVPTVTAPEASAVEAATAPTPAASPPLAPVAPAPVAIAEPAPAPAAPVTLAAVQTAAVLAVPPKPAPPRRIEALAAIAALSEDEKIALFS
jgi:chemotaxis regulatin CheY-phosphate phosphatase CheZ